MAYVIPSIRMAPRPVYTPRLGARANGAIPTSPSGPGPDFQTLLNKQAIPPPLAQHTPTPTPAPMPTPAPPRTMGTVTLGMPFTNPVVNEPAMAPSAQSLFGANPWVTNPGGNGPNGGYGYNKYYFATPETAAKVAQMMGGKVVAQNYLTPLGPFVQNQPNQMIQMPDGRLINAGIIASYYDRGSSQQTVDRLVNGEIGNMAT